MPHFLIEGRDAEAASLTQNNKHTHTERERERERERENNTEKEREGKQHSIVVDQKKNYNPQNQSKMAITTHKKK